MCSKFGQDTWQHYNLLHETILVFRKMFTYIEHREAVLTVLAKCGWPVEFRVIALLENEIKLGEFYIEQVRKSSSFSCELQNIQMQKCLWAIPFKIPEGGGGYLGVSWNSPNFLHRTSLFDRGEIFTNPSPHIFIFSADPSPHIYFFFCQPPSHTFFS